LKRPSIRKKKIAQREKESETEKEKRKIGERENDTGEIDKECEE
jgi:hypothetical protein